jgi:GNAT superfamily N-acetyltransferase
VRRLVTITYLEMNDPAELTPARDPGTPFLLMRAEIPSPELNRFLYTAVGAAWTWYGRLPWSRARWTAWLDRPELETWVAYVSGTPAGYFELERQPGEQVELVYFGLLPAFVGKGLGGALLTAAIRRGWELGARRVWVHTCDLDHPLALRNYEARGFRVYKTERAEEELPDRPLEPWPGASTPETG